METDEKDQFFAQVVDANGTLRISIPKKVADLANYNAGDNVKVWIKKVEGAE
jgi:hypothetical protein